jgi:hypothetical protein
MSTGQLAAWLCFFIDHLLEADVAIRGLSFCFQMLARRQALQELLSDALALGFLLALSLDNYKPEILAKAREGLKAM